MRPMRLPQKMMVGMKSAHCPQKDAKIFGGECNENCSLRGVLTHTIVGTKLLIGLHRVLQLTSLCPGTNSENATTPFRPHDWCSWRHTRQWYRSEREFLSTYLCNTHKGVNQQGDMHIARCMQP